MSWRETIEGAGDASFRGVPFKTTDAEIEGGRRTVVHEYPERDRPYPEDMGKRAKQWRVEGFVIGDDYLGQRDALIEALEAGGPGELRHPRYGVLQVSVVGHVSVKENHREGGMARFSISFVDAGDNVFPGAREDTVQEVDDAAGDCEDAAEDIYADALDLAGPASVLTGAISAVKSTVDGVLSMVRQVTSLGGLSSLVRQVVGLAGSIAALIRTPVVFAQSLRSIFNELVQGVRRPLAALQELQAVFDNHARPTITARAGSTAARIIGNQVAHNDLVRALSITAQARMVSVAISGSINQVSVATTALGVASGTTQTVGGVAIAGAGSSTSTASSSARRSIATAAAASQRLEEAPVATAAQALALRDALLDQIDAELETTEPEPVMAAALQRLRTAVARDVTARAELLRERSTFAPAAVLPAVVLAHRIYQDAGRVDELIARNGVHNPNFVPAAPLEVLQ
jgi:prophage DNA circulation protein